MSDPAVEASRRAWAANTTAPYPESVYVTRFTEASAREALSWTADVIAQEKREQWQRDKAGMPCAQMIAQRLDVLEKVIRDE